MEALLGALGVEMPAWMPLPHLGSLSSEQEPSTASSPRLDGYVNNIRGDVAETAVERGTARALSLSRSAAAGAARTVPAQLLRDQALAGARSNSGTVLMSKHITLCARWLPR